MIKTLTVLIRLIAFLALCTVSFAESTPVPLKAVRLPLEAGILELTPYSPEIVRVCFYPDPAFSLKESLAVIAKPSFDGWTIKHGKNSATLTSANLQVEVDSKSGVLSFADKTGSPLLKNADIPRICNSNPAGGSSSYRVRETFQIDPAQGLYGLGQYQDGKMNYRNTDVRIMQANKISVNPFLLSTANWGLLWDNYSDTQYQDRKGVTSFESEYGDAIDYYIVVGDSMDEVIAGYRHLTGAAPMFGKWAYGFWQCKERYTSFQELKDVVSEYRRRDVPIDNIIQDWRYWGEKGKWSSMEFDPATYPDAGKNIQELHNLNVKLMVSIWPSLGPDTKIYKEFDEKGYLLDNKHWCTGKVYDPFNPAARARYWDYIKCGLIDKGVDALWMDGTEPEFTGTGSQDQTKEEIAKVKTCHLGPILKYANAFSLETTRATYEGQRADCDGQKRIFTLSRSAFAGQQRYAAATWSGDVGANFDIFRKQISAGVNFCMSGIPYWTHDIGAFFLTGHQGIYTGKHQSPSYREFYTRWYQFGAFSPLFRSHGTQTPREIWQFGDEGDLFYEAIKKFTNLRYRLMPYIYSQAGNITQNGGSLMRGLPMDFSQDPQTYGIDNAYLFGPSLLVQPVTQEMYYPKGNLEGEVISSEFLTTAEGAPGLSATYCKGKNFEEEVRKTIDPAIDFNWGGGPPIGLDENDFSIAWDGFLTPVQTGVYKIGYRADDGIRIYLHGKLFMDDWNESAASYKSKDVQLEAGRKVPFRVEYFQAEAGSEVKVTWMPPSSEKTEMADLEKSVPVYLPAGTAWIGFWTGETLNGGQTATVEAPIDRMPLFAKAGSILPMGPLVQYIDEKPADPIELRIYPGANGTFTLYEDEGDSYNYEKGFFATIPMAWDDAAQTFTIGTRQGSFPGMLQERTFQIIRVKPGKAVGVFTLSPPDKTIKYTGKTLRVQIMEDSTQSR